MIYYKDLTILILTVSITLSCNMPAAMQQAPQKQGEQKQGSLRQTAMPILEALLPKVLAAMVRDYLPRDYQTYQHYKTIETDAAIVNYQWSRNANHILTYHTNGAILWDIQKETIVSKVDYDQNTAKGDLHPNSSDLLMITNDFNIKLYDLKTQEARIFNPRFKFYSALFNSDGSAILALYKNHINSQSYRIGLFDSLDGTIISSSKGDASSYHLLAISPNNKIIAYISHGHHHEDYDAYLLVHDMKKWIPLTGHEQYVMDMDFSHDNKHILTVARDWTARLWQTASGKQLRIFHHDNFGYRVRYSPDGPMFLIQNYDGKVCLFNHNKEDAIFEFAGRPSRDHHVTFASDGSTIAIQSDIQSDRRNYLHLWKDPLDITLPPSSSTTITEKHRSIKNKKRRRREQA